MAQRRRRTTRRYPRKTRVRRKKGISARRAVQGMRVTPAQRKRLRKAMRDFERHINTLTRKYNQLLNTLSRW